MGFSKTATHVRAKYAGFRCECDQLACGHTGRCGETFDATACHQVLGLFAKPYPGFTMHRRKEAVIDTPLNALFICANCSQHSL